MIPIDSIRYEKRYAFLLFFLEYSIMPLVWNDVSQYTCIDSAK